MTKHLKRNADDLFDKLKNAVEHGVLWPPTQSKLVRTKKRSVVGVSKPKGQISAGPQIASKSAPQLPKPLKQKKNKIRKVKKQYFRTFDDNSSVWTAPSNWR